MKLFVNQNQSCCFQTVNGRFTTRKWATFDKKVAEFLTENNRVIMIETDGTGERPIAEDNYAVDGRADVSMLCMECII